MVIKKKKKSLVMSTMAGSIAISSPLAFTLPVDAITKEQFEEIQKLSYGEHHEAVVHLQKKLKTLNFYQGDYTPKYDALTEHALKQFQKQNDINATGEADETTYLKLEEELDTHYKEIIETLGEQIQYGEQSNRVRQVQKALDHYGFYKDKIDSIAGPATKKALERMSKAYQLDLDLSDYTPIVQVTQTRSESQTQQSEQSQSNVQQAVKKVKTKPQKKQNPKLPLEH
ncbi:peptidoglycan-binding domain-containing protein [Piscibacillus salipiscarius]|uniref:peptidoglycan-binding domain-containing protein n=1 Tax=Piscibacillus salipiscarius TaxID=299480 RepID=UPI0006D2AEA3|nr:peptidoglycan-binding protein [Piscibacillus salipiscarius]